MNERIKELAEQTSERLSNVIRNDEWLDKFAKLIVRECAMVCKEFIDEPQHTEGHLRCAENVKAYFGIEE